MQPHDWGITQLQHARADSRNSEPEPEPEEGRREAHNRCNRYIQWEIQGLVEEVEVLTKEHEE